MKRLLITGASGFLGFNLCQRALASWQVFGTYFSNPLEIPGASLIKSDLTRFKDIKGLFESVSPNAVIHTAAMAKPDICEKDPNRTETINVSAAVNIAGLCSDYEIPCVFTSSDLVFDGEHPPYKETDEPSPLGVYGEQKVRAEIEMKKRYPKTVICRMALMFGDPAPASESFLQSMIRAMKTPKGAFLFIDQFRTPLFAADAADGLLLAIEKQPDILHLGGPERLSRYDFGLLASSLMKINVANITPCLQKNVDLLTPRSPDVSLDISKAISLGFTPKPMDAALKSLML